MEERRDNNKPKLWERAIWRVGILLLAVMVLFLFARQLALPDSFGQYGYYRGDNIDEWAALEAKHAFGNETCSKCHQQTLSSLSSGNHEVLNCQACHGPAANHIKKPKVYLPKVSGTKELCGSCHRELIGRAEVEISTVELGKHSGGLTCSRCHDPHQPKRLEGGNSEE